MAQAACELAVSRLFGGMYDEAEVQRYLSELYSRWQSVPRTRCTSASSRRSRWCVLLWASPAACAGLVIGNSTVGDTVPVRGREVAHPGRGSGAGIVFVNDQGTECGGLMWWGDAQSAGIHLSFDSYEQNDAVIFAHTD